MNLHSFHQSLHFHNYQNKCQQLYFHIRKKTPPKASAILSFE